MAAKWDVDTMLYVPAKVVSVTSDETGTIYQVKTVSQDKIITQFYKEDELLDAVPSA